MRRDSAETAAVNGLMQHLALSHPDISFRFLKDGAEALLTPGDGRLESAVYAALGRDFARGLVPVSGSGGDVSVTGFVTAPLMGRGSRSMQVFFVNGRFIKSQLLTAALEEGYRNQIMKGRFPGCVLAVTLPVTAVDVNVHPAKTQVKFAREHDVFDAVYHTVLDALDKTGAPAAVPAKEPPLAAASRQDFFQTMDAKTFRQGGGGRAPARPARTEARPAASSPSAWNTELRSAAKVADSRQTSFYQAGLPAGQSALGRAPTRYLRVAEGQQTPPTPAHRSALGQPPASVAAGAAERPALQTPRPPAQPPKEAVPPRPFVPAIPPEQLKLTEDLPGQTALEERAAPWRIAGEVLNTYIICEDGAGNVWLIDKHAAHERINFDRLKASREPPMRQTLLTPIAAELSREDGALLLENLPELERFGFACEDFGDGTVLVREVPADIDAGDTTVHPGGIRRVPADRPLPGGAEGGAAPHHGLQGRHQGRLGQRPGGAAGAGGQSPERRGQVLPPRPPGGGEADEVRAGEDVQAGVTGAGESGRGGRACAPLGAGIQPGCRLGNAPPLGEEFTGGR